MKTHDALIDPANPAFQMEWMFNNVTTTFFKCTRWQVEETTDPIDCPYHYFCDSTYEGNYPSFVDITVLSLTAACYLIMLVLAVLEIRRYLARANNLSIEGSKRYWIASGPIFLPIILIALAKGHQINTVFPLIYTAPALLQLVQISVLAFESPSQMSIKSVFLEVSTLSGILHGSLYTDSVILPYYTGLDALVSSSLSGECTSCVCRREVLTVGRLVPYRGWSATMFAIAATLCFRLVCSVYGRNNSKGSLGFNLLLEAFGWLLSMRDSSRLVVFSIHGSLAEQAVIVSICVLMTVLLLMRICHLLIIARNLFPIKDHTGLSVT